MTLKFSNHLYTVKISIYFNDPSQADLQKVIELANLFLRNFVVSQKIFKNITYNPYIFAYIVNIDMFSFTIIGVISQG